MLPLPLSVPAALAQRRATRHFDPSRSLDPEILKQILQLATLAPSGYNLQPWRFLVIESQANRQRLRGCAFNQPKLTDAPVVVIVLGAHFPDKSYLNSIIATQRELGILTAETAAEMKARTLTAMDRVSDRALWTTRSTMLAAMSLMLAAESLGIASAPMEGFDAARVAEAFGVPDDHSVCCLICLGHALKSQLFPGRLPLEEVCFEEHFGRPWTLGEASLDSTRPGH